LGGRRAGCFEEGAAQADRRRKTPDLLASGLFALSLEQIDGGGPREEQREEYENAERED